MFISKMLKRGLVVLSTITLLLASTATMAQAATLTNVTVTPRNPAPGAVTTWDVDFSGAGSFDCVRLTSSAISGSATLATATSPAAISVTNGTATTGTSVTVETLTGGCSGTVVDTGTSSVSIQPDTTVRLTVDGSFSLSVDPRTSGAACGAITSPVTTGISATDLNLGAITATVKKAAANDLTVSSNAVLGWDLNAKVTPMTGPGVFTETAFDTGTAGAYAVSWDGTTPDNNTLQFPSGPSSTYLVGSQANNNPTSTARCVGFQAQPGTATPAGAYSSTVTYTAVPKY